jgi:hypothetical protein
MAARVGEAHHCAKITAADVRAMRAYRAEGASHNQVFVRFGLPLGLRYKHMIEILARRSWKHVE